ncbi:hypothetical protein C8Q80DRAFT_385024 [Daedaleopsis nitida]|nr:hypothetical protein C8Q80DRAFT_385024 [Daedaleopsis nitida]
MRARAPTVHHHDARPDACAGLQDANLESSLPVGHLGAAAACSPVSPWIVCFAGGHDSGWPLCVYPLRPTRPSSRVPESRSSPAWSTGAPWRGIHDKDRAKRACGRTVGRTLREFNSAPRHLHGESGSGSPCQSSVASGTGTRSCGLRPAAVICYRDSSGGAVSAGCSCASPFPGAFATMVMLTHVSDTDEHPESSGEGVYVR